MLDRAIEGNSAWRRRDVRPEDYRISLSPACHDELRRVADEMRRFPLPTIVRHPDEFDLPQCRATMAAVRDVLDRGVRFAVLDRLPLDELGAEAVAVYWLLSSMLARPVAQKLDGTLIYDVLDTGRAALPGSGVRPDQTNIELKFHNDNSYNATPPDYVGLLCLRAAPAGAGAALSAVLVRPPARVPPGRGAGLRRPGVRGRRRGPRPLQRAPDSRRLRGERRAA